MTLWVGDIGSGEWKELTGVTVGPIEFAAPPDWHGDTVRTIREYSGHLTFNVSVEDRMHFRWHIERYIGARRSEASRMHTAYHAKTRRRNRRRK